MTDTPTPPATDEREAVARALCEKHIRNVRRHDTDAATLEAVLPGAIEMHWFDFQLEADAALSALAPYRAAEIAAAHERATTAERERDALRGACRSLLQLCESAGLGDDLMAAVFPDSKNRSGQTRDKTAKQARRTMNEARAALNATGAA